MKLIISITAIWICAFSVIANASQEQSVNPNRNQESYLARKLQAQQAWNEDDIGCGNCPVVDDGNGGQEQTICCGSETPEGGFCATEYECKAGSY